MTFRRYLSAALLATVADPLLAHTNDVPLVEELVVYGRATEQLGKASAASEGLVGYADIHLPPLFRVGELVEAVPGVVATQHSGTGKANQYFLRGFNLDHGTDFSAAIEGMPVNMRTHGHGQGYLDLNFLIPELVEYTAYKKGPYTASVGDFSSAGSVAFKLYDGLSTNTVALTAGNDSYYRYLGAATVDAGGGELTGAFDGTTYSGPWDLDEDLEQYKGVLRYVRDIGKARMRLTFMGYDGEWASTDQIPERAVESGQIGRLGFIDPDLGGETSRYSIHGGIDFGAVSVVAYAMTYDLALYSNFTYLLDDPDRGDQFEQRDDRDMYGASVTGIIESTVVGLPTTLRWGVETRLDDIAHVGLFRTVARERFGTVREDSVEELSLGAWGELETRLTDRLRSVVGLRADYYDFDVRSDLDANSGHDSDDIVGLKAGLAFRFTDRAEGYANWGQGFHSNDVRGVTITIDPATGEPAEPVDALVESRGAELGLRYEIEQRFNATLAAFWLELDSELVFVGDAGTTEPNDASERRGVELTTFWQATDWLAFNAVFATTDAEFANDAGFGTEIPGAVASTATLGATAAWSNGFNASARVRYLGEAPLIEDDSVRTDDSLLVNFGLGWERGALELRLDLFNAFDSDDDDISYFYASRLAGEPAEGIEDVHFHPLEPRTVRASIGFHW